MVDLRKSWDIISDRYLKRYEISTDVVHYGPLCPGDDKLGLVGNLKDKKVIDLGCGCGQNAIALARLGADVTAIDFSLKQIGLAKELAAGAGLGIDFRVGDIQNIPQLNSGSYDFIVSACAISFVDNPKSVFDEAHRLLKPGSRFILSDMNPLQYIIDEIDGGVSFNNPYPAEPILMKWRWDFDDMATSPRFQHYVRSIPQYCNTLIESGFAISKILEPKSTIDTPHIGFSKEIMSEYSYIADHLPITFIIICNKS